MITKPINQVIAAALAKLGAMKPDDIISKMQDNGATSDLEQQLRLLQIKNKLRTMRPLSQPQQREVSMDEIKAKIDKETLFLFAYVPFVIAEVAWDYADSCRDMAIIMRLHPTKKLCRAIRELRLEYDRKRSRFIDQAHRDIETEQMINFQEDYKSYFSQLNINIQGQVNAEHPGLDTESRLLISGAYSCAVVLRALFRYAGIMERRIADILGIKAIGSIIIKELRQLEQLIIQFAGEDSIGSNNRFPDTLNPFVETLTNYMLQSEMIELPIPNN